MTACSGHLPPIGCLVAKTAHFRIRGLADLQQAKAAAGGRDVLVHGVAQAALDANVVDVQRP